MAYERGERLPESFGIAGEWVKEGLFLFAEHPPKVPFKTLVAPDIGRCVGFNIIGIAEITGFTPIEIMNANRLCRLNVTWERRPAEPGADISLLYTITIDGEPVTQCLINWATPKGNA